MSAATPTIRELLTRMLEKVEEMRRALDAADSVGSDVDSVRAREALDDLERRVRALMAEAV
jgi:hypothetical protein